MIHEFIPVIGSIVAACIAGAIAFLTSVFTKENKISEFRQAWIEGLRDDVSEFASLVPHFCDYPTLAARAGVGMDEFIRSMKADSLRLLLLKARIELRLNPKEHKELIFKLRNFEVLGAKKEGQIKPLLPEVESMLSDAQLILKEEWRRVKRGEPIYRVTKWTSLALLVCTAIMIILKAAGL